METIPTIKTLSRASGRIGSSMKTLTVHLGSTMKTLTVHLGDCLNHDNGLFTIIYKQKKAERALLTVIALCKF
jgi:hypothetical protein